MVFIFILHEQHIYLTKPERGATLLCSYFYADFTKSFDDIIDHSILVNELASLNIDQTLYFWIRTFLTNITQELGINHSLSPWRHVRCGVPQGIKLGRTLFAIMLNNLLRHVDDTTVLEVIPRNCRPTC